MPILLDIFLTLCDNRVTLDYVDAQLMCIGSV